MSCKLYIDNYTGTVRTGTTLNGRLLVHFNSEKNIRGIKVRFKCKEHTEWSERESHYNHTTKKHETRYVTYTGDNTPYFIEKVVQPGGKIGPGSFTYQLSFTLPHDLPSTYNGSYGTIHYYVKAVVDRPYKTDYEDKVFLNVFSPINFNNFSTDYQMPYEVEDEKTVCCCCCASGPITQLVAVDKRAFVVGETMNVKINVTNLSNVSVDGFTIKLKQRITTSTRHPGHREKTDIEYITSATASGVGAHGEHAFVVPLDIPELAQLPNFSKCELFDVAYKLEVVGELEGCHSDLETEIFPLLGHVQHEDSRVDVTYDQQQNGAYAPPPPYVAAPDIGFVGGFDQPSSSNGAVFPPLPSHGYVPMPMPNSPSAPSEKQALDQGGVPNAPSPEASAPELPPPTYDESLSYLK